ncbi:MAG: hypothetical protein AAF399_27270, partial [Bacteroidota bacterium]
DSGVCGVFFRGIRAEEDENVIGYLLRQIKRLRIRQDQGAHLGQGPSRSERVFQPLDFLCEQECQGYGNLLREI